MVDKAKTKRALKQVSPKVTPIGKMEGEPLILPNHSGYHGAQALAKTPTKDFQLANKKYVDDASTAPGGSDTEVQFNDSGSFGGDANFTWDASELKLNGKDLNMPSPGQIILKSSTTGEGNAPLHITKTLNNAVGAFIDNGFKNGVALVVRNHSNNKINLIDPGSGTTLLVLFDGQFRTGLFLSRVGSTHTEPEIEMKNSGQSTWNLQRSASNFSFGPNSSNDDEYTLTNAGSGSLKVGIGTNSPTTTFSVSEKSGMSAIGGFCIKMTNKTGANTVAGNLVRADTAVDDAFILTAATDDEYMGVVLDAGVSDGSEAWIVVHGIADVLFDDNVAAVRANWVGTGQAGLARTQAAPPALGVAAHFEEVGHSIESVTAGGEGTFILARVVLQHN
jgi:hypothetical protein